MIKSNCRLCSATGFLDAPKELSIEEGSEELNEEASEEDKENTNKAPPGKIICTRCDGKILLTPEEWESKGFPGMIKSNCKLCSATGFLDAPNEEASEE